jgi:CheY-like chemotaxis protein
MQTIPRIILCADDDPDDRELLCETASKIDPSVKIVSAVNGEILLQKLYELDSVNLLPCLIILDMNMPILDGKETLEEIRKNSKWDNIPVTIFTTSQRDIYTELEKTYGVVIVTKPDKYSEIIKEVTQMLSYCRAA